jgi:isopentenyl phosphate kinase
VLSSDTITEHLSQKLSPQSVTFLTDVPGIYDRPPPATLSGVKQIVQSNDAPVLLRKVEVDSESGKIVRIDAADVTAAAATTTAVGQLLNPKISGSLVDDVTGGMELKFRVCLQMARRHVVFVVEGGSPSACEAMRGHSPSIGTTIDRI